MGKQWAVYAHENQINGKIYIGTTSQSLKNRFRKNGEGYFRGYKRLGEFQRDILRYGWGAFRHCVILGGLEESRAKEIEKKLIAFFGSNHPEIGYNQTLGGDGIPGYRCPDELKAYRSERMKNRVFSEETRKKMSEAKKGFTPWNKGKRGAQSCSS